VIVGPYWGHTRTLCDLAVSLHCALPFCPGTTEDRISSGHDQIERVLMRAAGYDDVRVFPQ